MVSCCCVLVCVDMLCFVVFCCVLVCYVLLCCVVLCVLCCMSLCCDMVCFVYLYRYGDEAVDEVYQWEGCVLDNGVGHNIWFNITLHDDDDDDDGDDGDASDGAYDMHSSDSVAILRMIHTGITDINMVIVCINYNKR